MLLVRPLLRALIQPILQIVPSVKPNLGQSSSLGCQIMVGCTRNNPKLYERSFNIPKQGFVPSSPMLKTKVKDNKKVNLNSPIWTPTLVWPRNTHHGLRDSIPVSQQT